MNLKIYSYRVFVLVYLAGLWKNRYDIIYLMIANKRLRANTARGGKRSETEGRLVEAAKNYAKCRIRLPLCIRKSFIKLADSCTFLILHYYNCSCFGSNFGVLWHFSLILHGVRKKLGPCLCNQTNFFKRIFIYRRLLGTYMIL